MKRMLRKRDLIEQIGLAKSTVSDWIYDFQVFIPTVKQGSVTYYLPEAIDVLLVIKELREQNYAKPDIMQMLSKRGFPVTVKEAEEDMNKIIGKADYRDGFLKLMETMGESVSLVGVQTERLNNHDNRLDKHEERIDGQDGRIDEMMKTVQQLQKELAVTQEQLDAERKKSFIKKLFGR